MKLDVSRVMMNARQAMSDGAFQQAGSALSGAMDLVREEAQSKTSSEIVAIIRKLQAHEHIEGDEVALIRAWFVGKAAAYTEMENNFEDWVAEFERLSDVLAGYEGHESSPQELLELHGILEDAMRVSYDIANYLEKRDRIARFESAIAGGLGKDEREFLARVLREKLESPDR